MTLSLGLNNNKPWKPAQVGKRRSAVSEKRGVGDHARIKKRLQNLFKATKTDFTDSGNISHITKTKKKLIVHLDML